MLDLQHPFFPQVTVLTTMLSGRWWSSTWGSLGLGPQNPSRGSQLCALYAFTYTGADGRQVSLAEGDRFLLLRKTNSDWWLARRLGAPPTSRPIFVPAAYMTEESIPCQSPTTIAPSQSLWTPGEYSLPLPASLASRNYWKALSPSRHLPQGSAVPLLLFPSDQPTLHVRHSVPIASPTLTLSRSHELLHSLPRSCLPCESPG